MMHDTPPKLDPNCQCICHTQPGVMHVAACCRVPEMVSRSEADAMVAAVLREAARTGDRFIIPSLTPIMQISEMQLGRDAAAQEMQQRILALIPQPASAALDKLIAEAEAAERERCAKIADAHAERFAEATYKTEDGRLQNAAKVYGADEIAAAIRAANGDQT